MTKVPMNKKFDLEERTAKFGEEIIRFSMDLPKNEITRPIVVQLVKCGTSIVKQMMLKAEEILSIK